MISGKRQLAYWGVSICAVAAFRLFQMYEPTLPGTDSHTFLYYCAMLLFPFFFLLDSMALQEIFGRLWKPLGRMNSSHILLIFIAKLLLN